LQCSCGHEDIKQSRNMETINQYLSSIIVEYAMEHKPITIYQTDTVGHAAELMLEEKIGGLPVIDTNGKLVGLITESDIFRMIVKKWRDDNLISSAVA